MRELLDKYPNGIDDFYSAPDNAASVKLPDAISKADKVRSGTPYERKSIPGNIIKDSKL